MVSNPSGSFYSNCGKITFLFTLAIATPQQKAFCVLEFTKANARITAQRSALSRLIVRAFDGELELDRLKRVKVSARKEPWKITCFRGASGEDSRCV